MKPQDCHRDVTQAVPGRVDGSLSMPKLVLLLASLLPGLLSTGCGQSSEGTVNTAARPASSSRDTPVIIISVDTLRSDRLGAYGFEGVQTPAIDRLASDGVLFERAYSHLPLTLPSHASILTGRLPIEHGVRDNLGYRLGQQPPTLGEILTDEGYATGAFVSAYVLREQTGIARGFQAYDDDIVVRSGVELGGLQRKGGETLERAFAWLDGIDTGIDHGTPFFLFFHIYEPHSPYTPSEPWATRYPHHPYDAEVAEADAVVGELISGLEQRGLYDESLVVLLSDHGEGLGDHGEIEHEVLIYRETLQVPLIFKLPGGQRAGERIAEPTQLIDVFPTILAHLGLDPPPADDDLQGMDLLGGRPVPGDRQIFSESIYPRLHFGWSDLASLIEGRYHYIQSPAPELYDLIDDPGETRDILRQNRAIYRRLSSALAAIDREIEPPSEVDADVRERLATLGYVGGGVGVADGDLPDPKSRIGVLEELGSAGALLAGGRYEEAARAYGEITDREPNMIFAWEQLAKSHRRAGELDEAKSGTRSRSPTLTGSRTHRTGGGRDLPRARRATGRSRARRAGAPRSRLRCRPARPDRDPGGQPGRGLRAGSARPQRAWHAGRATDHGHRTRGRARALRRGVGPQ